MNEPKKILIVEDEREIADLIMEFCRILGFDSQTVQYGSDALATALAYRPDLITLDLILPDISGLEVMDNLRAHPDTRGLPVVIISSIASEPDVRRTIHSRCQGVMTKPFRSAAFKKTLHRVLSLEPVAA